RESVTPASDLMPSPSERIEREDADKRPKGAAEVASGSCRIPHARQAGRASDRLTRRALPSERSERVGDVVARRADAVSLRDSGSPSRRLRRLATGRRALMVIACRALAN